ncbi:hypothetical protein ANCDUO_03310 [Ancylostoma duodenale]|uniref:Uncharacterized protein n=1 Tax=Ancylostoma duodenale TaxID=51022 RepID=A0A0C2H4B9_9BILA|nr:hypothetical protein ANCDUO_03310 [Ancylostoma duodenale]
MTRERVKKLHILPGFMSYSVRKRMYRLLIHQLKEIVQITDDPRVEFLKGADMAKIKYGEINVVLSTGT